MKRLRELEPDNRLMARAHELIDAIGPTVPSEARLHRVRRALDQPIRRPSGRVWALRGASALAIVGVGASALAFSGAFSSWPGSPSPAAPTTSPLAAPTALADRSAHSGPRPSTEPPVAEPSQPNDEIVATPKHRTAPRSKHGAPSPPLPISASEVARVHEAAKALRGDGDPERALRLLDASENVKGPLAEEALALRIEAAHASRDPRAKALAQSYLSRYPGGRYRELARRTLAAP
jgi:hypothetical protein